MLAAPLRNENAISPLSAKLFHESNASRAGAQRSVVSADVLVTSAKPTARPPIATHSKNRR